MPSRRRRKPPKDRLEDAIVETSERLKPDIGEDELRDLLVNAARAIAESVVDELHAATPVTLIDHAALRAGFEIRLRDPLGPALDRFEQSRAVDRRARP